VRILASPIKLHDVRDVEVFVRSIIDHRLKAWSARLSVAEYESLLSYLIVIAWALSGLQHDTVQPRRVWYVTVEQEVERVQLEPGAGGTFITWHVSRDLVRNRRGPYPSIDTALAAVRSGEQEVSFEDSTPPGAFDPTLNTSFSKYAFNILALRVVDWYRDRYHDARYGDARHESSLEQIAADLDCSIDEIVRAEPDYHAEEAMLYVELLTR
jgi:hypothetical protein